MPRGVTFIHQGEIDCCEGVRVSEGCVRVRVYGYVGWFTLFHSVNEVRGNKASERESVEEVRILFCSITIHLLFSVIVFVVVIALFFCVLFFILLIGCPLSFFFCHSIDSGYTCHLSSRSYLNDIFVGKALRNRYGFWKIHMRTISALPSFS